MGGPWGQDGAVVIVASAAAITGGVFAAAVGAAFGSFAGVALERLPQGEPVTGRSHCVCGEPVRARDNVPVFSYLVRRGRARCCGAVIPRWYLAVELGGAVLAVALYVLVVALVA
jgi:leader peptidase (prepilin peptidase) / N-methyltransferase